MRRAIAKFKIPASAQGPASCLKALTEIQVLSGQVVFTLINYSYLSNPPKYFQNPPPDPGSRGRTFSIWFPSQRLTFWQDAWGEEMRLRRIQDPPRGFRV